MEFTASIDLNEHEKKLSSKIEQIDKFITDKKKEIEDLGKFKQNLLNERSNITKQIEKIKKQNNLKKNLKSPLFDEMEDSTPVSLHEYSCLEGYIKEEYIDQVDEVLNDLENCNFFKENSVKFGDIIDKMGNRHYGYSFVGKNGVLQNTNRDHAVDSESGVTVPFEICKYLIDSVSKYKNLGNNEGCIVAYELPYYDVTVKKYNVKKNQLYEYVCWNEEYEEFDFNNWYLEEISIETGKRTKPKLKKTK